MKGEKENQGTEKNTETKGEKKEEKKGEERGRRKKKQGTTIVNKTMIHTSVELQALPWPRMPEVNAKTSFWPPMSLCERHETSSPASWCWQ